MRMNPNIALGVQMPDLGNALMSGFQARQQRDEREAQNALQEFMRQQGGAIMKGDQNALAQLAQYDPTLAMRIQSDQQAMGISRQNADLQRQQFGLQQQQAQHGMAMDTSRLGLQQQEFQHGIARDRENMGIAREELEMKRQQIAQETAKHAATMDQVERERAREEIERTLAGATQIKGPEEWAAYMTERGMDEYADDFDQRETLFAEALGIADGLAMNAGPAPNDRYRTVGDNLVDLTAEGGPKAVFTPKAEPGYTTLAPEEVQQLQLPEGAYQRGPDGKVSKIGGGGVTVNNNAAGGTPDDDFYQELSKKDAANIGTILERAPEVGRTGAQISKLEETLATLPTGGAAALQQLAGEFGIKTDGLGEIQAAQALVNSMVPAQRPPGSGPMSDADLALFKQSLPRLINTPEGNRKIVETMRAINQYDQQVVDIATRVANGEMRPAEGRTAMSALSNPLANFTVDDDSGTDAAAVIDPSDPLSIPDWIVDTPLDQMTPEQREEAYRLMGIK